MRSNIKAIKKLQNKNLLTFEEIKNIIEELLPTEIESVRDYQNLQALLNCTRRSLLPAEYLNKNRFQMREEWMAKIADLEKKINN